jgi:polyhydroxybutyrate depolymerase
MRLPETPIVFLAIALGLVGCVTRSERTIEVNGDRRTYQLHVPQSYDGGEPIPLLLVLHPFGSTGFGMATMTGFDALSEREKFIAVYPDGAFRRWRTYKSRADLRFLLELLDALESEYAVDPTRIYIAGASNGAHMTYRMLCEAGHRFAAAATVMGAQTLGRIDDACTAAPPVPLMMIHGTADRILPWDGRKWPRTNPLLSIEQTLQIWLARNGCTADGIVETVQDTAANDRTKSTRTVFDRCSSGAPVVLYTVEGGGHTWPGGNHNYPPFTVGRTARDFNASQVIWDFFAQFSREQPRNRLSK